MKHTHIQTCDQKDGPFLYHPRAFHHYNVSSVSGDQYIEVNRLPKVADVLILNRLRTPLFNLSIIFHFPQIIRIKAIFVSFWQPCMVVGTASKTFHRPVPDHSATTRRPSTIYLQTIENLAKRGACRMSAIDQFTVTACLH